MSNLMVDYKVISVAESPIIEVFYPNDSTKRVEPNEASSGTGMVPNTDFNPNIESKVVDELDTNE